MIEACKKVLTLVAMILRYPMACERVVEEDDNDGWSVDYLRPLAEVLFCCLFLLCNDGLIFKLCRIS